MNPYRKLISNSALFAVGNLGSRIISIILVPLYTYYLTTTEYGIVDIVISTSNMILPVISLSIYQAVMRFIMEKNSDADTVLTNGFLITTLGSLFAILTYPILNLSNFSEGYLKYLLFILILHAYQALFAQYTRAIGHIAQYALNGIIMSFITGATNVILLVYFEWGITGYLTSIILSNVVSILYLGFTSRVFDHIYLSKYSKKIAKSMLKYSVPLIPNSFMWWIINASNRYFILLFVGADANGLFAVANKIPSLLTIVHSVFFQAWQLSAIEEYNSHRKSKLYSNVFNYFSLIMFMGTSGILVILKFLIGVAVHQDFYDSWKLVPYLLLGVTFSSFSSFLGTNYIAAKQTKGVFNTSVFGGIVSIISNFIFVPMFGSIGAGLSTMLSFLVIWILRYRDTKKFIDMTIDVKSIIFNLCVILGQIIVLYIGLPTNAEFIIQIAFFIILLIKNYKYILSLLKLFKK